MCMIDGCDDFAIVLKSIVVTARKPHECSECVRTIMAGEKYTYEALLSGGDFRTHKTCRHCIVVREWLLEECGGFVYGCVEEDISDHAWEGYGIRVKMMAAGMARMWGRKDGRMWPLPRLPLVSGHQVQPQ